MADSTGSEWLAQLGDPKTRLFCADHLVASREEKREIARQFGAVAVDMESATIARRCHAAGISFAAVRAISDTVHDALSPRLTQLLSGGEVSPWRVAWNCLRYPQLIPECIRLAKHTNLAARNLTRCSYSTRHGTSAFDGN